ncbi:alpha/beta hydrolase [Paenibacillus harenae]|uniref:Phospholipase/carboxylesterase n=1 Tax=Paenibacillus harenae TaxID=306543 RepID=A0ABT9U4M7_PAEHA|nr:alpha/beta hydrolase [Paenibacillus harenae]MDQ0062789.1 phospholipase/carboxylesterase [Paenibacillus harenae]MDQ0113948.1 phospholipase/carboxylesterase [Paenibacillus harenae]
MKHIFEQGDNPKAPTLLLLHGTGGSEQDLLGIGRMISPGSSLLGVKGNVSENGHARFFRRLAEGIFDEEDLIFRTEELKTFVDESAEQYKFDRNNVIAVGYSNGANIAGSLLFHYENVLNGAILFHPMVPRRGITLPNLGGTAVFIGAGDNDPICPPNETTDLSALLEGASADVTLHWESYGHQLTRGEVLEAVKWFNTNYVFN